MKDIRQTSEYADYISKVGWKVETIGGVNYFIRKFPIVGSFIKIQRPESLDLKVINNLGRKHRAFQIVVEPKNKSQEIKIKNYGFKKLKSPFLPSLTLCLSLTNSKEKIFAGFKKDARAAIRKNNQIEVFDYGKKVLDFRQIWRKTAGFKRYVPTIISLLALKKSFGRNVLFLNLQDSGAIFLKAGEKAYYWQAFTGKRGRKSETQYKIVWEGILWAKRLGTKVFDFEGIYDERFPNKSWQGFTHFKKSFGGDEVKYPGSFVKNLIPFRN